ncbi:MAG: acyltransferase family protein [Candidatus Corynebacterium faecigallinarum]
MLNHERSPRAGASLRRADIDGLRGLAIALVVIFHVFVGRVSSGVDVFLLLGGIFFFAPQIRNALNPAGLTVVQAVLRIIRRLYPALVTVVAVSLAAALGIYASVRWIDTGQDAAASLLYVQNLNLIHQGQDYAAISQDVSLFQHIWSMSVQLQIYLGSLVVITVLCAVVTRVFSRTATAARRTVVGLLVVATVVSLGYATWMTAHDQAVNYYSPLSRFWEIGLGGLFGLWVLGRRLPGWFTRLRIPAGLIGLVLIVGTGLVLDGAEQFPGPWTLVPLAGAVLVVLAGSETASTGSTGPTGSGRVGVARLLETRVFQLLGRYAYSLYLWHWPVLTLATYLWAGRTAQDTADASTAEVAADTPFLQGITATLGSTTGTLVGTGVIVVSLVLAAATHRFVEVPLQQTSRPTRSWVLTDLGYLRSASGHRGKTVVAVGMVAATVGVIAFAPTGERVLAHRAAKLEARAADTDIYPGPAAFLQDAPVPEGEPVVPATAEIRPLMPLNQPDGCYASFPHTEVVLTHDHNESDEECAYGDVDSDRVMYLAGGSHSEHFLPALDIIGRDRGIKIVPIVKMGCVLGMALPRVDGSDYPECAEWELKAQQYVLDNPPTDGVFMTVTRPTSMLGDGPEQIPDEYAAMVQKLTDAGIHTYAVRDTPWMMRSPGRQLDARKCVAEQREGDCGVAQEDHLLPEDPSLEALVGMDVTHIDLTDAVCRDGRCPGVVGNVLVYRDTQHLTNRFVELLAPEIERQMYPDARGR